MKRIREELAGRGLDEGAIRIAVAPQEAIMEDISWEVTLYERLKAGDIEAIPEYPPDERGRALICLRIVKGWNQRELADALNVSEAVVSRDERNEYNGISLERYGRILAALGFEEHPRFETAATRLITIIPSPAIQRMAASFIPPASLKIPSVQEV
jgi:transcriptional regulator with XRE-family HTH domain